MKKLLILLTFLSSCNLGDNSFFRRDPSRTSSVIKDSSVKMTVVAKDSEKTTVRFEVFIKAVLSAPTTDVITRSFDNQLLQKESLDRLRNGEVFEDPEFRLVFLDKIDSCERLKFDSFPDDEDVKDVVIVIRSCDGFKSVKNIDAALTSKNRRILLGFNG